MRENKTSHNISPVRKELNSPLNSTVKSLGGVLFISRAPKSILILRPCSIFDLSKNKTSPKIMQYRTSKKQKEQRYLIVLKLIIAKTRPSFLDILTTRKKSQKLRSTMMSCGNKSRRKILETILPINFVLVLSSCMNATCSNFAKKQSIYDRGIISNFIVVPFFLHYDSMQYGIEGVYCNNNVIPLLSNLFYFILLYFIFILLLLCSMFVWIAVLHNRLT